ncbi:hypothetical protein BZG02_13610 [Labilibaculum filiforme]|uniref:Zinc ribbon domain-containing protein n=1 Tax=Labilibaculum filiforme TaxID=1940526 RepID=A0A2N3HV91_9BACT|nr:hypothetical protein BZG02_13610 [Labilibaculum filiforme]
MMNCLKCQTQNEGNANFCKLCGTNLQTNLKPKREDEIKDSLLLIFIIIGFVSVLVSIVMPRLGSSWLGESVVYIQRLFWFISSLSFLLIPFAITNKNIKTIGLIFSVVSVLYWIYLNIQTF